MESIVGTTENQFSSLCHLWYNALHDVDAIGEKIKSRDGECKEILGQQYTLVNINRNFITDPIRKMSPWYAAAELLWYLSGTNEIKMIEYYAPQYKRFSDDGITTWGAYGHRWAADFKDSPNQIEEVINLLRESPQSRRAVITCYSGKKDLGFSSKDIPCTVSLQFLVREQKLHCICTMRSNDIWLGMPYDIWSFTCLQILIAQELDIEIGSYTHQPGSLHLYDRNYKKVDEVLKNLNNVNSPEFKWYNHTTSPLNEQINQALFEEKEGRSGRKWKPGIIFRKTLLGQCSIWCGFKTWDLEHCWPGFVENDEMRKYITEVMLKS